MAVPEPKLSAVATSAPNVAPAPTQRQPQQLLAQVLAAPSVKNAAEVLADWLAEGTGAAEVAVALTGPRGRVTEFVLNAGRRLPKRAPHRVDLERRMMKAAKAAREKGESKTLFTRGEATRCTHAIVLAKRVIGVVDLVLPEGFADDERPLKANLQLSQLMLPILAMRRTRERNPLDLAFGWCDRFWRDTSGRSMFGRIALMLVAAAFLLSPADFEIKADATVEGTSQRTLVAPFESYIAEVRVQPGDSVAAGDVLASFDVSALELERSSWRAEFAKAKKAMREAAAKQDRARLQVLSAQAERAEAELDLIRSRLARRNLIAPISGVLVSGDLTQKVGAPVATGDPLFDIVPHGEYRVRLLVNERQIERLSNGQRGRVTLNAYPGIKHPIDISRITSVTETDTDGVHFIAQADIDAGDTALRPGMQGLARVTAGQRPRIGIWTEELRDWLRLMRWRWIG